MRINAVIWVTPLFLSVLSGCLGDPEERYQVYATAGKFAIGFAYDGKGVESFAGPAFLDVDESANTGVFVAQGKAGGTDFRVVFEDFKEAAGKSFQDGGIAADFIEHGASGVGDKSIPEVDLEMAGWGLARIETGKDKALYKDPISGRDNWTAHFMVIRNGVRDDMSGQIHTMDHMMYGPEHAMNGSSMPGDYELHLVLRNQTANASAASQIGPFPSAAPAASPTFSAQHKFSVAAPGSTITLELALTGTGVSTSNLSFVISDPSGDQAARRELGPGMTPASQQASYAAQLRFPATETGEYSVQVTGRLAPGSTYSVKGVVTPPPSVVLNFWWEDLVFGAQAHQQGDSSGMLEGTRFHGMHEPATGSSPATTNSTRRLR